MANLFEPSDFTLFSKYQNKTQSEDSTGQKPLRELYDKLGRIVDGLSKRGYHCEITRNPLMQGGPGVMKYAEYHWSRIYPKDNSLYNGCYNKIFVVVGTTEDGVNIHIDSYTKKGYYANKEAEGIKNDTWLQIDPDEASTHSCEDYVNLVDKYFHDNWKEFNQFGKEFGIEECIKILNNMTIDNLKGLLLGNYNLILTGAPGTGKTYLAKRIAEGMGCDKEHMGFVQFHPSYDYTDFVEGLRPIKQGNELGFQRKDGVFKEFCKKALQVQLNASFEKLYESIVKDIASGILTNYTTLSGLVYPLKVENGIIKYGCQKNGTEFKSENIDNVKLLYEHCVSHPKDIDYSTEGLRDLIKRLTNGSISTLDPSEYSWTIKELLSRRSQLLSEKFVFIIDEINRGEISKIFGELFYSIDPGYRGEKGKVNTQYQNLIPKEGDADFDSTKPDVFRHGFFVPDNVYIIGTMNDIDRSVESMDFAMCRRFAWQEITAESRQSMLDEDDAWTPYTKPGQSVIEEIKNRMNNLNACIVDKYKPEKLSPKDKIGLTTAYHIGASYFLKYALYNDFDKLWGNHLEGLLREYLRGTTNLEDKINRLMEAYNDTQHIDYK